MSAERDERVLVFLAGGLATRLRDRAAEVPKVLQPVAGRPLLDHLLETADRLGFDRLHFSLGHLHEPVLDHLRATGRPFTWSLDDVPGGAGTAGALRAARPWLSAEFVVWLADTLPPPSLTGPLLPARGHGPVARMGVSRDVPDVRPNITLDGDLVAGYDKGGSPRATHVDAGVYAMRDDVLDHVPPGRYDLERLWPVLIDRDQLAAQVLDGEFLDIGTPSRLATAHTRLTEAR